MAALAEGWAEGPTAGLQRGPKEGEKGGVNCMALAAPDEGGVEEGAEGVVNWTPPELAPPLRGGGGGWGRGRGPPPAGSPSAALRLRVKVLGLGGAASAPFPPSWPATAPSSKTGTEQGVLSVGSALSQSESGVTTAGWRRRGTCAPVLGKSSVSTDAAPAEEGTDRIENCTDSDPRDWGSVPACSPSISAAAAAAAPSPAPTAP